MRSAIALGFITTLLAACGYDSSDVTYPPSAAALVTIAVTRSDPMTSTGDMQVLAAVVRARDGSVVAGAPVSWRSSAPAVATVAVFSDSARVTAVDDGAAVITAASGTVEGTITVTVRRTPVAIALSGPDSVVVAGTTSQLTVVGRDARQHDITRLTDVRFASSNPFSVLVSPSGLVTALFSPFMPRQATITATVPVDGGTLSATKQIDIGNPAPSVVDFIALMLPEAVRPEPSTGLGQGVLYLTLDGAQVRYKMLWSLLTGPAASAHLHGPDGSDAAADILVDLPLGTQTATNGVLTGSFTATDIRPQAGRPPVSVDSLVTLAGRGFVYVDLHTPGFRDGEMRGSVIGIR